MAAVNGIVGQPNAVRSWRTHIALQERMYVMTRFLEHYNRLAALPHDEIPHCQFVTADSDRVICNRGYVAGSAHWVNDCIVHEINTSIPISEKLNAWQNIAIWRNNCFISVFMLRWGRQVAMRDFVQTLVMVGHRAANQLIVTTCLTQFEHTPAVRPADTPIAKPDRVGVYIELFLALGSKTKKYERRLDMPSAVGAPPPQPPAAPLLESEVAWSAISLPQEGAASPEESLAPSKKRRRSLVSSLVGKKSKPPSSNDAAVPRPQTRVAQVKARHAFTSKEREMVWNHWYDKNSVEVVCFQCRAVKLKRSDKIWEMSHVNGHAACGSDDLVNIVPVCVNCNGLSSSGAKVVNHYDVVMKQYKHKTVVRNEIIVFMTNRLYQLHTSTAYFPAREDGSLAEFVRQAYGGEHEGAIEMTQVYTIVEQYEARVQNYEFMKETMADANQAYETAIASVEQAAKLRGQTWSRLERFQKDSNGCIEPISCDDAYAMRPE